MTFIVGFSRKPSELVHVFIDRSSVEIEGKKTIIKLKNILEEQLYVDYGRLLRTVLKGRQMGDNPIIGSYPPVGPE